ncbi:MAG: peptide-methionine (S)-S-oxide reductase MsrA, partial [Myxococcota bacterium]|nr:peptide-methionine (S)-S-oxide reductase MsrA [Myxococcota bacterium]
AHMLRAVPRVVALTAALLGGAVACAGGTVDPATHTPQTIEAPPPLKGQRAAVFAGGCFWCMEKPFDKLAGVVSTTSGYTGGRIPGPSYRQVSMHQTQHYEALRVVYDPGLVSYERLLEVFWHNVDPTQSNGQFCDKGDQYRTGIFTSDPVEVELARTSRDAAQKTLGKTIVTEILPAAPFWIAEEYHQDFYTKNPDHYARYRSGCGRDRRLAELWGDAAGH